MPTMQQITAAVSDERGATALEYGLMITLVAAAVAVALGPFGDGVASLLEDGLAAFT